MLEMMSNLKKVLVIVIVALAVLNVYQFTRNQYTDSYEITDRPNVVGALFGKYDTEYDSSQGSVGKHVQNINQINVDDTIPTSDREYTEVTVEDIKQDTDKDNKVYSVKDTNASAVNDDIKTDSFFNREAERLASLHAKISEDKAIIDSVLARKKLITEGEEIWAMPDEEPKKKDNRPVQYHGTDLMKHSVPNYDPHFKNPCWYQTVARGNRTLRCLPYVYVIGVKKCGTSDLFLRLSQHPDFAYPGFKEAQFFARGRFKSLENDKMERYVSMFGRAAAAVTSNQKQGPDGQLYNNWTITGEASPSNLHLNSHWRNLPGNENLDEPKYVTLDYIHHFLPKAKIIILFRDPVDRLYSDYYHEYGNLMPKHSPNPQEFHDIVVKGLRLYRECFAKRSVRSCVYDSNFYSITRIQIQLGIYYVFWEDLTRLFPRDQIMVLQNKDLKDKEKTMTKVYDFLGLRRLLQPEMDYITNLTEANSMELHNNSRVPMLNVTRERLQTFYKPFNIKFSTIMKDDRFLYNIDNTNTVRQNITKLPESKVPVKRLRESAKGVDPKRKQFLQT